MQGIRQDLQRSKDDTGFAPNGVGNAYSHNFLNQKPWHPANFRNQAKVYEAEQKKIQDAKKKDIAKAEFEAEQEYLKTLSFLSPEEQERHRERQGVQFLYMKPPGADSMPEPAAKASDKAGPSGEGLPREPGPPQGREPGGHAPRSQPAQPAQKPSYLGNMLGAVRALQNHDKWEVRQVTGLGRSPPRGNADPRAENQQILVSDPEDEEDTGQERHRSGRKRRSGKGRLAEAEAVLRDAGYDIEQLRAATGGSGHSSRKSRREKKRKRDKSPR